MLDDLTRPPPPTPTHPLLRQSHPQVLGKRLGGAMKEVGNAVKALSSEQVLAAQAAGFVEVAGQRLDISEIKVCSDGVMPPRRVACLCPPVSSDEPHFCTWSCVLVVLALCH